MPTYKITLIDESTGLNSTIECGDDTYILDAALERGLDLKHSTLTVPCVECAGKLVSGTVDQSDQSILNNQQMEEGYVLLCVAYPRSDCFIETGQDEGLY
jgi:ferredoxin